MPKKKKEKIVKIETPGYYDPVRNYLFEQVIDKEGQYAYCEARFIRGDPNKFHISVSRPPLRMKGVDEDGNEIFEVGLKRLPWPEILFPSKEKINEIELWQEIYNYVYEHVDFSEKEHYAIVTSWIMATWIQEKFDVVPYIFVVGPLNSGKTRLLEVLWQLCYRGLMSTSIRPAGLFRACEAWHPTVLLDEAEIYTRSELLEVMALLNSGYRRGQCAIRVEKIGENKLELGLYDVYGFKAVACTQLLSPTFQSRCFIMNMSRAIRKVKILLDKEWAKKIRAKLMRYRIQKLIQEPFTVSEEKIIRIGENGRLTELFIAPLITTPKKEVKKQLIKYGEKISRIIREEELTTIEAEVLDSIIKSKPFVERGKIPLQIILEYINENKNEKQKISPQKLGRIVKKLGFKKARMSSEDSRTTIYYDEALIMRLARRYQPSTLRLFTQQISSQQTQISSLNHHLKPKQISSPTQENDDIISSLPTDIDTLSLKRWIINLIDKYQPEGITQQTFIKTCITNGITNPDKIIEQLILEGKITLERKNNTIYLKLTSWPILKNDDIISSLQSKRDDIPVERR